MRDNKFRFTIRTINSFSLSAKTQVEEAISRLLPPTSKITSPHSAIELVNYSRAYNISANAICMLSSFIKGTLFDEDITMTLEGLFSKLNPQLIDAPDEDEIKYIEAVARQSIYTGRAFFTSGASASRQVADTPSYSISIG